VGEQPNSWFVESAQQPSQPPAPPLADLPLPALAADPVAAVVPQPTSNQGAQLAGMPFWLDYLVPVCAGGAFLLIMWLIGLVWLLKR
jgi:hypothetical protein